MPALRNSKRQRLTDSDWLGWLGDGAAAPVGGMSEWEEGVRWSEANRHDDWLPDSASESESATTYSENEQGKHQHHST